MREVPSTTVAVRDGTGITMGSGDDLKKHFKPGCYLLTFRPATPGIGTDYGSLRVEGTADGYLISGDLYHWDKGGPRSGGGRRRKGVPVFPLEKYRFYLRGDGRLRSGGGGEQPGVLLQFETFEYDGRQKVIELTSGPQFAAALHPTHAAADSSFTGPVTDRQGQKVGTMTLAWVSPRFRQAQVDLELAPGAPRPLKNAAGLTWRSVFAAPEVNWDVRVTEGKLAGPGTAPADSVRGYTLAELHERLLGLPRAHGARRGAHDAWRYALLCVRRIQGEGFERGVMFDYGAFDLNATPREGAAIASGWVLPKDWGLGEVPFGTLPDAYFRTGVHEIGHALGLDHNFVDNGFMNTTDQIVADSKSLPTGHKFPKNIRWQFNARDAVQLRHGPDIAIRPGGMPWRRSDQSMDEVMRLPPVRSEVSPELELVLVAPAGEVPLGAPVRIAYRLVNRGQVPALVPRKLSLSVGNVSGCVLGPGPSLEPRHFRPLVHCLDQPPGLRLAPGGFVVGAASLLRGPEGLLFPQAGGYDLEIEAKWWSRDRWIQVTGRTRLGISPVENARHTRLLKTLRETPEVLFCLVAPGEGWRRGNAVLTQIVEGPANPLRQHYAYFQAKRWATPHRARQADYAKALDALPRDLAVTHTELRHVARWLRAAVEAGQKTRVRPGLAEDLGAWAARLAGTDPELREEVERAVEPLSGRRDEPSQEPAGLDPTLSQADGQRPTRRPRQSNRN